MKFSIPALTTLALVPTASAWSNSVFFGPGHRLGTSADTLLYPSDILAMHQRRKQKFFDNALTRISPRYEIQDTEQQIQISLDVPGVSPEDINVTVEEDGKVLAITAQREKIGDNGKYTNSVSQSFSLDPVVDIEKFSANLKNGVLVVTAPKDLARLEKNIRKIPVAAVSEDVETPVEAKETIAPVEDTNVDTEEPQDKDKVDGTAPAS
eukprot:gb/GEZJ01006567.1/.p1 GENE.gb/GEZJ01006567.1/~~gb/GEZJ01006567.1/.p1  ORF type:complete len:209 (-),score=45.45 gb/GEZJ01006567.1/:83-709(-)